MSALDITLNGAVHAVSPGATVAALVAALGRGPKGVAVAVNDEVVPRSQWAGTELRTGDRVEVLQAAQGGC